MSASSDSEHVYRISPGRFKGQTSDFPIAALEFSPDEPTAPGNGEESFRADA
jgi:hypothetical protein